MTDPILAPGARTEPILSPTGEPVPVTLLTGFLGAGKTTLLNRILEGDHGLRVGVLVNDFGAVNIDAELIAGVEENTIALTNGCVCCEVRDDLVESLEELLDGNGDVEYVIIEASGIADPEGVVMTLSDRKYDELLRLDSVTCVVDAEGVFRDDPELSLFKLRQIGFADLVVLNKVDLVAEEAVAIIRDWIGHHLRRVRIVEAEHADVPLEILLSVGRFDGAPVEGPIGHPTFDTWLYQSDKAMSGSRLRDAIRRLPGSIYRTKGIVDDSGRRIALQSVGRRTSITDLGPWNGAVPSTDIVVIGRVGAIDAEELRTLFDGCRA